jgi:uncharacterized protein (DUF885 family)
MPNQLADELTEAIFDANPVAATVIGIRDREDRLPDFSEDGEEAFRTRAGDILARIGTVDAGGFGDQDRVTLAVVRALAEVELDQLGVRAVEYTVTDSFVAPATGLLAILPMTGISEQAHADGYLARLWQLPTVLAAVADRHRAGHRRRPRAGAPVGPRGDHTLWSLPRRSGERSVAATGASGGRHGGRAGLPGGEPAKVGGCL